MRLIVLFSILFLAFSPNVHAKTKSKHTPAKIKNDLIEMQDVQRYFLTWDKIQKMSPKGQLAYYKFLLKLVAQLEEMQPYPGPKGPGKPVKKTAMLDTLKKLMNEIQPEAYAATGAYASRGAALVGKMCIYGAHASAYAEFEGGAYYCNPLGVPSSCPNAGDAECNSGLFNFMSPKGGGQLCVPRYPENQTATSPGLTARCVEAFEARLGGRIDEVVKSEMAKMNGNKDAQKEWKRFVDDMKKAVNDLESTDRGGVNLRDYCAQGEDGKYNAINDYRQHEECAALYRLFANVKGSDIVIPSPQPVVVTPTPQAPATDKKDLYAKCHNDSTHPELGELACVNCAIREAGPGSRGDASKWVALLAITAKNAQKNEAGDSLKNRVIKMLLSTSYCTDAEYGNDPGYNPNGAAGFPSSAYKNYGFSEDYDIKNLLGDYKNNDASGFPWNFEGLNVFYRRARYGYYFNKSGSHSHYSSGLKSCLKSAGNRLQNNPAFNYCAGNDIELNNPTLRGDNATNSADLSALMSFCNNLVNACDGTDKSICLKNNLIANNSSLNEKERRTKGDFNKLGTAPRIGYYSENYEMAGNKARCPRREPVAGNDGGANGTAGPSAGSSSSSGSTGGSSGSH